MLLLHRQAWVALAVLLSATKSVTQLKTINSLIMNRQEQINRFYFTLQTEY